ncbi:MAG: T9SS type A sorting domain-containing protein [Candidatus Kapabacteria bacterium]|nr:T9SS type A sorting domain-containing protein [Candidatus Kapabacteria bacterium]
MMKVSKIVFILIIVLSNAAFSQWESCNEGLKSSQTSAFLVNDSNIFAGGFKGIFLSSDDGNSWVEKNSGLSDAFVRAIATDGNSIFVGIQGNGSVFKSTDYGNSWTKNNSGLTDTIVRAIAINGTNIFAGTRGGIFVSNDYGNSWFKKNDGLTDINIYCLAISGNDIFAGTRKNGFVSKNNGISWSPLNIGSPSNMVQSIFINGNTIFAGTGEGLFLSQDNGINWIENNPELFTGPIISFAISGTNIFAATSLEIFLSKDSCKTWTQVNSGTTFSIIVLAVTEDYIFVGTNGNGLFKAKLSDIGITDIRNIRSVDLDISVSPNPVSDILTLSFSKPELSTLNISIINSLGIEMKRFDENELSGRNTINFSTQEFPSGIYYCILKSGLKKVTKSFVIMR